jgi:protein O-GlcNAc transferase
MTTEQSATLAETIESAVRHHQKNRLVEAEAIYRAILDADPENLDALHLLGVVEYQRHRPQEAVELISRSLAGNPSNYHALNHLGEAYRAMQCLDEAMTCFERALDLKEDYFQAYNNMGNVYHDREKPDLAIACYQKAIAINPDYAEAHTNLGNAFQDRGEQNGAIACYRRSLEIRPDFAPTLFNLGNIYKSLRLYDEAIPLYQKAIVSKSDFVDAHLALARSLQESGEREEAIASFERACSLQPENPEAQWGIVFCKLSLVPDAHEAVVDYRATFADELDELDKWFRGDRIDNGYSAIGTIQPFYLAYHEENNRDVLARYGALCNRLAGHWQNRQELALRKRSRRSRIRLGLVSSHIRDHSVWHALIKGWCQQLDERLVDLYIFSTSAVHDTQTDSARSRATQFLGGDWIPHRWAKKILEHEPDVLLYPEIGMDPMTAKLATLRLAPVQATTWGHPETSGLPTMDYYISATDFEPADAQHNYTERLFLLPHLGCYYPALNVAAEEPSLEAAGIDAERSIFICPGTPFKYAPQNDWTFVEIAKRIGRCQFVFFKYPLERLHSQLIRRLGAAFASAGLDVRDFVVEIPWLSKAQFTGLMRRADLYLDTIGFSGFNTAMQAVECGLPIVTKDGRFLRGRLASGIMKRLGVTETIAASEEQYVDLAVTLAEDRSLRADLRSRIEKSRQFLFDDLAPVRALEELLLTVAKR